MRQYSHCTPLIMLQFINHPVVRFVIQVAAEILRVA